ncbi:septin and tuftelin-interacting protein 1 homolog 1 [Physcomitrium patens]|uniref:G-patch domain-containing protein n=1 Tax=Physcomitrium patens TaxID=3218 RepID=A0A2K1ILW7_PHYPA|nr:septin and tuftelin-interacting protein 1 homolog 1-like [Physcomitrium patens]XP_024360505.1 septin and tuftelin-interacting protein 1 homolog 1-like [Physcomitrium patens]XP_024360506.1 septin and tuftelin-interacting protein 1 homolog 1-like [Physcomitrium patens]XP_024360507.1 septin and tuftelin-interacting protein 1 homolog 1-like [Physcomitrium patens]XP_024360509.1 septin and tuftelin-interacting protein 1 homolog 1-like [Physcomitrium patens]XP_024360510.1 septin and tuftelin-inter|eukprot:XP_024360504.1 septin and tuftelin-interacting protein 1 homolog 1-like [Physcomitrella patens]
MDEYQHYERFNLDNDFEDGKWIGGDFFARKQKGKKRQSKEEALYGVDDSDSDYEESGKRRRRGDNKKSDLTKPVSFVSTGTVMPSEEIDKEEKEEHAAGVGAGLGFGTAGLGSAAGLGFDTNGGTKQGDNAEEEELLPTAFGRRIKEGAERRELEREKGKKAATKAKSLASGGQGPGPSFEMFTRGIGSKLLEKMGYKGGGLGKNEQGIAQPIEAKLRPKNMGMGFNEFRETSTGLPPPPGMQQPDEDVVAEKPKSKERLWTKKNRGKKKTELRTAAELLAEKEAQNGGVVRQTVLDMRGPQPRLLTNLENLNAEQMAIEDNIPMAELQHNLRLIVDLTEAEVQTCNQKLQNERDTVLILNKDRERLETAVGAQRKQIAVLEDVMASLEQIQRQIDEGGMTLESLASAIARVRYTYRDEFKLFSVGIIALSMALPLMNILFRSWQPFVQPLHGIEAMTAWQELLQGNETQDHAIFQDIDNSPYIQLVLEIVFPHIRLATTNMWQPRDPEPMLRFLEAWDKLLPGGIKQSILEGLVMPKLTAAVDAWDPRLEEVPIHAWLHPWLPWLGARMEPLYVPIRYKLNVALVNWHPGDSSALALLSPWKTVFDPANWEMLILRSIMPKLIQAMQEFVINPANQILDQFHWVMAWVSAVPSHHMINLLEVNFFPKWHQVLLHWLSARPDYDEVTAWFVGWKSLLPTELLANDKIRHQLSIALDLINQGIEATPSIPQAVRDKLTYLRAAEHRLHNISQQVHSAPSVQPPKQHAVHMDESDSPEMTLKEVTEAFAQENDVQFMPKPGRMHEGLQVYSFGAVSVVIDNAKQSILAQTGDGWKSVHLGQILEMHRSRGGSRWK